VDAIRVNEAINGAFEVSEAAVVMDDFMRVSANESLGSVGGNGSHDSIALDLPDVRIGERFDHLVLVLEADVGDNHLASGVDHGNSLCRAGIGVCELAVKRPDPDMVELWDVSRELVAEEVSADDLHDLARARPPIRIDDLLLVAVELRIVEAANDADCFFQRISERGFLESHLVE